MHTYTKPLLAVIGQGLGPSRAFGLEISYFFQ
jgi:hypothetical protein